MFQISGATIDFSFWAWFAGLPISEAAGVVFALGAWVFIAAFLLKSTVEFWVEYRSKTKFQSKWEWVLMAVDIPPLFIQTPKAVEQIFAHLSGAMGHSNVSDKFWHGKKQKNFSFEIISIEGYIQFLVRAEKEYRDLMEASIYAQYPEAEITEVEDYISVLPGVFPNNEYDVLGVEFKLAQPNAFPIRTYESFEYSLSKEAVFSDPMAAILENFSRIGPGENFWMQIVVEPTSSSWKEEGIALAKEMIKGGGGHEHGHAGGGLISAIFDAFFAEIRNILTWTFEVHEHEEVKPERVEVTPGMKKNVEHVENKIAKIGFKTKLRVLYAARKEVFNPNRCIEGFIGSMNQFHIQDLNAIVPYDATHAHYDPSHSKSNHMKNTFVKAFKARKMKWKLCDGYILNIEELATLWHFPLPFVKTPLLHKAGHKRAEPPSGLPVETVEHPLKRKGEAETNTEVVPAPPEEIPYA